ncbi:MAG TPA: tetratricopeptide repeat protein [Chloroflexota bacterium]
MVVSLVRVPRSLVIDGVVGVILAMVIGSLIANFRAMPPTPVGQPRALDARPAGERAVASAQQVLAAKPDDPAAMANLATAYLLRVRETGDPSYYPRAEALLNRSQDLRPDDPNVLLGLGSLAASRHDFTRALAYGQRAVAAIPGRASSYSVVIDALVELGRYDEAVQTAQHMVNLRPDQASYSRISYLRELHGDLGGAIDAMRIAVGAGAPDAETTAWCEAHIGNLLLATGDLDGAEREYQLSLLHFNNEVYGMAGLARVRAARGDMPGAAEQAERAVKAMPLPEFAALLGDIYAQMGDDARAQQQYELVGAMQQLFAANGVRTDLDIAAFNADHGVHLDDAVAAAQAEYAIRPSVTVADVLSWTEYRAGHIAEAAEFSREAMRLGSRDPLMLYHAGVIAQAAGDAERAAALLRDTYALSPSFSLLWAHDLAQRVQALDGAGLAA